MLLFFHLFFLVLISVLSSEGSAEKPLSRPQSGDLDLPGENPDRNGAGADDDDDASSSSSGSIREDPGDESSDDSDGCVTVSSEDDSEGKNCDFLENCVDQLVEFISVTCSQKKKNKCFCGEAKWAAGSRPTL